MLAKEAKEIYKNSTKEKEIRRLEDFKRRKADRWDSLIKEIDDKIRKKAKDDGCLVYHWSPFDFILYDAVLEDLRERGFIVLKSNSDCYVMIIRWAGF